MGRSNHLSDEQLVALCVERSASGPEDAHMAACDVCDARRLALLQFLGDVADAAVSDADAVFTEERLATQRARILQRVEQDGRPARVIAFPAAAGSEPRPLRARPAARWIAGAAAAGLAIGLLAGHLVHDLPELAGGRRVARTTSLPPPQSGVRVVNASVTDEELLGEIESAVNAPTLAVLRPLNDLTPQ